MDTQQSQIPTQQPKECCGLQSHGPHWWTEGDHTTKCPGNLAQQSQIPTCTCYVRKMREEISFSLHYGAHNPSCPTYRESRDPVDHANDKEFRERVEPQYN